METTFYISLLISYFIFISLGYYFSGRFEKPFSAAKWILIITATIVAGWIGIGTVVDIFNFIIKLNWCLQGFGIGFIIGILKNKNRSKVIAN
jgi:hypothetical protein